jgi:hypothetical protein
LFLVSDAIARPSWPDHFCQHRSVGDEMKPASPRPTNILGIFACSHDSTACLPRAFVYALF